MTKTLLLHASNAADATEEIEALGGRVTQHLSHDILLATVPDEVDEGKLQASSTAIPPTLDENSKLAVSAWQDVTAPRVRSAHEVATEGLKWDTPGFQHPESDDPHTHAAAVRSLAKTVVNNDMLIGKIAVGLVFVSCSGGLEFSESEIRSVSGQASIADQFLAEEEPGAQVTFKWETHHLSIPGDEKVLGTGMSESPSAVVFNDKLYCFHQGFGKSGELRYNVFDGSWAGDKLIPGGMSESPSAVVFDGKLYCFRQGFNKNGELRYNVFDGLNWAGDKKVDGTKMSESPSAVVFKGKLYCFYQGFGESGELRYNVFDGAKWTGDKPVPGNPVSEPQGMSESPSAVVFNDKLYCFRQDFGAHGKLQYNVFDGAKWTPVKDVPRTGGPTQGMSESPSAVVFNDKLYCFYQGLEKNGKLRLNIFSHDLWNGEIQVDGVSMSSGPSAVVFNNQTYCFHQGGGDDGQLWFRAFDQIERGAYVDYESIWRNPALKVLGYPQGYAGCVAFADALCQKHQTTRAYIAFCVKFRLTNFAYASGVRLCINYSNDNWGPFNIYGVFTHETCHIFGAADEYGGCSCSPRGVYKVPNGNCKNCTSRQVACVMDKNSLSVCYYTRRQLGWLPQSGLFAFHNGFGKSDELRYTVFNGKSWWNDKPVPDTRMSESPSAAFFGGKLYCFHQGSDKNGKLRYNVFDGLNWAGDKLIPDGMSESPSAVVFNGKLYCFYQGFGANGELWYNVFDGTKWEGVNVAPGRMSESPSAVVFDGKLYCFRQGSDKNGKLQYNVFDGDEWTTDVKEVPGGMSESPSAVVFDGKLYCFRQGFNKNGELRYNVFDGLNWAGDKKVDGTKMSESPSAVVFKGKLYCFYQGFGESGELRYNVFDGAKWEGDRKVFDIGVSASLSAVTVQF